MMEQMQAFTSALAARPPPASLALPGPSSASSTDTSVIANLQRQYEAELAMVRGQLVGQQVAATPPAATPLVATAEAATPSAMVAAESADDTT